jgi:hypothetical protein
MSLFESNKDEVGQSTEDGNAGGQDHISRHKIDTALKV